MKFFTSDWWQRTLLNLPLLLMAFSFHEFAHAYAAHKLGDPTPKSEGRLTTNPLSHIDILGFILFIVAGFGWAKPVRTDPSRFKKPKRDLALVAASGPLMNLLLTFLFTGVLIVFLLTMDPFGIAPNSPAEIAYRFILNGIYLNVLLFVLNLLPVPPLDGAKILYSVLPDLPGKVIVFLERNGYLILILLIATNILHKILNPLIDLLLNFLFRIVQFIL